MLEIVKFVNFGKLDISVVIFMFLRGNFNLFKKIGIYSINYNISIN